MTSSSCRIQILFKCTARVPHDHQVNREATTEIILTTPSEKRGARREFLYHNSQTPTYLKKSPYTPKYDPLRQRWKEHISRKIQFSQTTKQLRHGWESSVAATGEGDTFRSPFFLKTGRLKAQDRHLSGWPQVAGHHRVGKVSCSTRATSVPAACAFTPLFHVAPSLCHGWALILVY